MKQSSINRLSKVFGMTRSPYDGEALNALRMFHATLDKEGVSWDSFVIKGCSKFSGEDTTRQSQSEPYRRKTEPKRPTQPRWEPPKNRTQREKRIFEGHVEAAVWALGYPQHLGTREAGFLRSIAIKISPLSDKQMQWMNDIMARLQDLE